jgi:ABC-type sugar transport system ATPase subunit
MFPHRYFIYISHNVMEVAKFCDSILVFRNNGKKPQTVMTRGCNIGKGEILSPAALDATLLEIMNAA